MFKIKKEVNTIKKILKTLLLLLPRLYYGKEKGGFLWKIFVKQNIKWGLDLEY